MTGTRFHKLTVMGTAASRGQGKRVVVKCDCGTEKEVAAGSLRNGGTKSCGCWRREACRTVGKLFGGSATKLSDKEIELRKTTHRNCSKCGCLTSPDNFLIDPRNGVSGNICKICRRKYLRTSRCRSFGITSEDYDRMFSEQNGVCAICSNPPTKRSLHIDHCHKTGKVRGLLCYRCNIMLGSARDDIQILTNSLFYLVDSQ